MSRVIAYLNELFTRGDLNTGKIEKADFEIKGILCPKKGHKDQVFITGILKGDRIKKMKYVCMYCDPYMYIAAEIASRIFIDKTPKEIENIDREEIVKITGIDDPKLKEHFDRVKYLILSQI